MRELVLCDAAGLARYAPSLRALEREVTYPLDDGRDRFFIDHGERYHPFFSGLGDARFLLAAEGDRVLGSVAGVFRESREGGRAVPSVYLCDLKVHPSQRGTGLARTMAARALRLAVTDPSLWRWRLAYGAAMRDARGDVTRSMRGAHAGRLLAPEATLAVYFVGARSLATLDPTGCPAPPTTPGLELSPRDLPAVTTTAGRKDLRRISNGEPWPLAHLTRGPAAWGTSLGAYLRACGETLAPEETACFTLDQRLEDHVAWLRARGVCSDTVCTVYTLRLGLRASTGWAHLSPSEI